MTIKQGLPLLSVLLFSVLQMGSQSTQISITITSIPTWGQDGQLTGYISGTSSQQTSLYLFAFIPDEGWYGLPSNCTPVSVPGGQFSSNAAPAAIFHAATRFTAYLMPASLSPQCDTGTATVPFEFEHDAVSSATIPRIPLYRMVSFGGLNWYVKDAPVQVYPGPQFFVGNNVFVDSFGQLHLQINDCSGSWCSAEVYTQQTIGYGTYSFTINSPLASLDPNLTLGLFTWDGQAGDLNNREWDIEFSRWGNGSSSTNAQYVVQPYNGPNNIRSFTMTPSYPSVHSVTWSPNQVSFASMDASGHTISQWSFSNSVSPVPTPGDVHLHLNFYISSGQSPSVPTPQEVIISGFQYIPAANQIGFSRVLDNIGFQSQSGTVPLTSNGSACSAVVESDSPWLTITGSNMIAAGGSVQYSVPANIGNPRAGNLILQSTNCNATLSAQVLTVAQAGLVCAPAFATPSASVGFLQSVFSVNVQNTASVCPWAVTSEVAWLTLSSPTSGTGNGSVTVVAGSNTNSSLRSGALSLNDGPNFTVRQDAAGSLFALVPQSAPSCGSQSAVFGLSWVAPSNVEIHLNSPTGTLVGSFGQVGTTLLNAPDGTVIYLIQAPAVSPPVVLGSAQTSVQGSICNVTSIAPLGIVNAASYSPSSTAPGSLATVFGGNLSAGTAQASGGSYPTTLGGVTVTVGGIQSPLWYVSPGQINLQVPSGLVQGRYTLTLGSATSDVLITNVSPGIFTLNGSGTGVPLAAITGVLSDGSTVSLPAYQCTPECTPATIALPSSLTDLYIVLYGTGIRNYKNMSASVGSNTAQVEFAGAQGQYPGLDQVNLHLAAPFNMVSAVPVQLNVDGFLSNTVTLQFPLNQNDASPAARRRRKE
jgi:uncharacterized protein (TIGR03437 family)